MWGPLSDDDDADAPEVRDALVAAPRSTLRAFVAVAVLAQAGLFAVALGALLVGFRGQWALGGGVVGVGLATLGAALAVYGRYRPR